MGVSKFSPASQRGVDATPTASSTNLVESGGVKSALNAKADQTDLASIHAAGTTNTTGATIYRDTFFYLNGELARTKQNILPDAPFTLGTNYIVVTKGGLNEPFTYPTPIPAIQTGCSGYYTTVGRMVVLNATVTKPDADWSLMYQLPAPKGASVLRIATMADGKTFVVTSDGFLQYRGGTFSETYTFSAAYVID